MASTGVPENEGTWHRTRGRHVVGPLILLGAGILLLLNNLQVVPWSIWPALWPFWPLLALAAGQLTWQIVRVDIHDAADCLAKFKSNRLFGWALLAAIVAGKVM